VSRLFCSKIACIVFVLMLACVSLGAAAQAQKLVILNVGSQDGTMKAVADFTAKTGIEVEVLISDWGSFNDKVLLMLTTGQQLDLIRCDSGHAVTAANNGWLYPLSNLIKRDNADISLIAKNVLWYAPNNENGEVWVLPYNVAVTLLFYHRGHFQEAGVDFPPVEYGHQALQWDNWIAMSKKLVRVDPDGKVTRWGTHIGVPAYFLIGAFNVDWVSPTLDKFLGTTQEVINAYNKLISVFMTEGAAPKPAERSGLNFLGGVNLASEVRQTGTWMLTVDPKSLDMGLAPPPWGSVVAVQGGVNSWGITSTTKNLEAAWEFLKFFTLGDGLISWMNYESKSPLMNRRYFNKWVHLMQEFMPNADLSVVLGAGNYLWNSQISKTKPWPQIQPIFVGALNEVNNGVKSMAAAMEGIAGQIDLLLKESAQ